MTPALKQQLADMAETMAALQAKLGAEGAPPAGGGGWLKKPAALDAPPAPVGWSVVMELENVDGPRGRGRVTVDLCYGPETWEQAPEIVQALVAQGYPVKVWVPKTDYGDKPKWGGRR